MCFIVGLISLAAAIAFYLKGLETQSYMSFSVAFILIGTFVYRMIKYRHCIFSKSNDCKEGTKNGNTKL